MIVIPAEPVGSPMFLADAFGRSMVLAATAMVVIAVITAVVRFGGRKAKTSTTPQRSYTQWESLMGLPAAEAVPAGEDRPARRLPVFIPVLFVVGAVACLAMSLVGWLSASSNSSDTWRIESSAAIESLTGSAPEVETLDLILACGDEPALCGGFLVGDTAISTQVDESGGIKITSLGKASVGTGADGKPAIVLDETDAPMATESPNPSETASTSSTTPTATPTPTP